MPSRRSPTAYALLATMTVAWVVACSQDNPTSANPDAAAAGEGGSSSGGGGGEGGSGGNVDGAGTLSDAASDATDGASGVGLLVDNMTAMTGTPQVLLSLPAGQIPGTYYVYSDYPLSMTEGTSQLAYTPVSPAKSNGDGSKIAGELCLGSGDGSEAGTVVNYAGLGVSLAYGPLPDAAAKGCRTDLSPPVPFDASKYSGVSFYIFVDATVGATQPSIRFGLPDTQTGDPCVSPTPACVGSEAGCYDDFGADVPFNPGSWTKVSFKWGNLNQGGWGDGFASLKTDQLVGMKWQANGPGIDAAAEPFRFCISDIYFTP